MDEEPFIVRRSDFLSALPYKPAKKRVLKARLHLDNTGASLEMWAHAKFCSQDWTIDPSQEEHKFPTQR